MILRRGLRAAVKIVRGWLAEPEAAVEENSQPGNPPYTYEQTNQLFKTLAAQNDYGRPQYLWGALQGINLAKALGHKRVSFLEFGVAGGNGLVALENVANVLEPIFGVEIETHGFDMGTGLPKPVDYRDLPNLWREGFYVMDTEKLASRLKRSKLHLGPVNETVVQFMKSGSAPVAFISFDLDYYSSTAQAFKLFEADEGVLLPRIHCYFDDIMGKTFSDFTGERLAIHEFNEASFTRKISPIHGLRFFLPTPARHSIWPDMMFIAHMFDHSLYGHNDGLLENSHHPLREIPTYSALIPLAVYCMDVAVGALV